MGGGRRRPARLRLSVWSYIMAVSLPILNLAEARYECTYGRGCDGVCCREGRPLIYPEEIQKLDVNLYKFLPLLRSEARLFIKKHGYVTRRRRLGQRMARHTGGWCVFFNRGCVLHKVGAAQGDKFRYKPAVCALFPIAKDRHDRWYVRQKGMNGEIWDLFCLDPQASSRRAVDSIADEIALAQRYSREERGE